MRTKLPGVVRYVKIILRIIRKLASIPCFSVSIFESNKLDFTRYCRLCGGYFFPLFFDDRVRKPRLFSYCFISLIFC